MKMKRGAGMSRSISAAALVAIALVVAIASPAAATVSTQTLFMVGGNTDATHPQGSYDPFTDVSIDNGVTWRPAVLSGGGHPWSKPAGTNSWLNCQSVTQYPWDACTQAVASSTPGASVRALFRYRFYIAADYAQGSLGGEFNVDNFAKFFLNGVDASHCFLGCADNGGLGIASWYGQTRTIVNLNGGQRASVNSLLQSGWNTFYVELLDTGGQSGIIYNLDLTIQSATPITVAAPGTLVSFDPQQGTSSSLSASLANGQALSVLSMPTATRSGFVFDGWFTAPTGGTLVDSAYAAATVPTTDITLYAHWSLPPTPVTFDPQQGTSTSTSASVANGQALSTITFPTATRAGFNFEGWFTAASGGTLADATYAAATVPSAPLTLYAQWTPAPVSTSPATVVVSPGATSAELSTLAETGTASESWGLGALSILALGTLFVLIAVRRRRRES